MCDPSQKHVLLVFAHQDEKSFNGALRDAAIDTLRGLGHSVEVSDLYSQHFEPRATKNDIRGKYMYTYVRLNFLNGLFKIY